MAAECYPIPLSSTHVFVPATDTALFRTLQIAGAGALIVLISATARAQDMRRVTESAFPPACAVLRAHWVAVGGGRTLTAADEDEPDTRRIHSGPVRLTFDLRGRALP